MLEKYAVCWFLRSGIAGSPQHLKKMVEVLLFDRFTVHIFFLSYYYSQKLRSTINLLT